MSTTAFRQSVRPPSVGSSASTKARFCWPIRADPPPVELRQGEGDLASAAPDLGTWLADLHLADLDGVADRPSAAVTLTTLHLAKGQEWPVVFLVGVEEGLIPYGRSRPEEEDEDERRLAFVGVSRPQVLLYLTYCRTRRLLIEGTESRSEPRQPSRSLCSLPPELVERAA